MVSLWPFSKADSNSAESFEKTLSALSTKISKASTQNDRVRQRARKLKVGWTLYGGFTYILALLIFFLVTGWRNWGAMEYSVVSGGPLLLYGVRVLLNTWYTYWMNNSQDYLESLYKERDDTLEKLKAATKYDSTQKLLEKYGGSGGGSPGSGQKKPKANGSAKSTPSKASTSKNSTPQQHQEQRVFMNPPPTANIQRQSVPKPPSSPPVTAEFAPNAYDETNRPPPPANNAPGLPPQLLQQQQLNQQPIQMSSGGGWMDRLVTALMGEDETLPTNRLALLCTNCRTVNGLAPPGVRTVEELGRWKCGACGAWNGVETEPVPVPGVGDIKSKSKKKVVKDENEDPDEPEEVEEEKEKKDDS